MTQGNRDRDSASAPSMRVCLILLVSLLLPAACAQTSDAGQGRANSRSQAPAVLPDDARCPSQDFSRFLQRYADLDDASVRARYTDDPISYEVAWHTVQPSTADSPAMHVEKIGGPKRLERFPFRYYAWADRFDRAEARRDPDAIQAMREGVSRYPLTVEIIPPDDRRITFGLEYQVDIFEFQRRAGCWYLTRAINPRD